MEDSYSKRIVINSAIVESIFTVTILLVSIITKNGNLIFATFCVISLLLLLLYKNIEPLLIWYLCLTINNSIIEFNISFLNSITLTAIIRIIIIAALVLDYIIYKKIKIKIDFRFFGIWICYLLFNSLYNHTNIITMLFSTCFPFVVCLYSQRIVARNYNKGLLLIGGLIAAIVIQCCTGYLELICNKTFFYSIWTNEERYRYGILRVGSTVADPNFLCLNETFMYCLLSCHIFKYFLGKAYNIIRLLLIISILLTFSRTGLIALLVSFIIIYSDKHRKLAVISSPIIAILSIIIVEVIWNSLNSLDVGSYEARSRIVDLALQMWRNKPIFGNGASSFYNISAELIGNKRDTMNEFVGELVNYGLIGLSIYVIFYIILIITTCHGFKNIVDDRKYSVFFFTAIISWIIMSFTLDTFSKTLIWILPAISIAIDKGDLRHAK